MVTDLDPVEQRINHIAARANGELNELPTGEVVVGGGFSLLSQ